MRLKELKIDSTNKLNLYIMELTSNLVVVISDDKAKLGELQAFAETNIVIQAGKVKRIK